MVMPGTNNYIKRKNVMCAKDYFISIRDNGQNNTLNFVKGTIQRVGSSHYSLSI